MIRIITLTFSLVLAGLTTTFAQQSLIASSGGVFVNTNFSLSWSLGDIAIETLSTDNLVLTQGMQQPTKKATGIYQNIYQTPEISIYPNPFKEILYINPQTIINEPVEIRLTDAQGKIVAIKKTNELPANLETTHFETGLYLLNLIINNQSVYTTYIVKQ